MPTSTAASTRAGSIALKVNGRNQQAPRGATVENLLATFDLTGKRLAISVNRRVVRRDNWATHVLNPADRVEIVHEIGAS